MSYTYLQEQGEEFLAESFADIPASALSRLNLTAERSCCNGSATAYCQSSRYGMTCEHSTASHGVDSLTSYAAGSRVRISAQQEITQDFQENGPDCGEKWPESLARYDPALRSWKTRQLSLLTEGCESLGTLPTWGMTVNGGLWALAPAVALWNASGFGLPAPTKSMGKRGWGISNSGRNRYSEELQANARSFGYKPHPSVLEWSMGWIPTWTRLAPLETDKFQQWLSSHGIHSQKPLDTPAKPATI